ncbi:MAG: hypothetical protein ACQESP_13145 [Candidatus Muiribacteriota bacterium]
MEKKLIFFTCFFIMLSFISNAWCKDEPEKFNHVMIGSHASVINNNAEGMEDDELSGFILSYQRNINKNVAFRGGYFADEHDDFSFIETRGVEAQMLISNDFTSKGFFYFGGAGLFSESWEYSGKDIDFDFSGYLLSLGIGYKWDHVVLDFIINYKDPGDYEDKINEFAGAFYQESIDVVALSGGLSIGVRF